MRKDVAKQLTVSNRGKRHKKVHLRLYLLQLVTIINLRSRRQEMHCRLSLGYESNDVGYNCTIFAYGQTGAGKTYTMMGLSF